MPSLGRGCELPLPAGGQEAAQVQVVGACVSGGPLGFQGSSSSPSRGERNVNKWTFFFGGLPLAARGILVP